MKYEIVVLRQVTERAWFEITGVDSEAEALAAYKDGEGLETGSKQLSTDNYIVEGVFKEEPMNIPRLFIEHQGVAVYHCYDDNRCVSWYWYTTNPDDYNYKRPLSDEYQFDVRDLPRQGFDPEYPDHHGEIIRQAIEAGLVTGRPAGEGQSQLDVLISVKGGVCTVENKPAGLRVEIVDHDAHDVFIDEE